MTNAAAGHSSRTKRTRIAIASGAAVSVVAAMVLIGWAFGVPTLTSLRHSWVSMKPNTAVGLLLLGIGVACAGAERRSAARLFAVRACAVTAALLGVLTTLEYAWRADFGIDQLLFVDAPNSVGTTAPGRMSILSALSITLLGAGVALLSARERRLRITGELAALAVAPVVVLAIVEYAFEVNFGVGFVASTRMALHTAFSLFVIAIGALATTRDGLLVNLLEDERVGSRIARAGIPLALIVPFAVGWARLAGERAGHFGTGFGVAIMVVSCVVMLLVGVIWGGNTLNRAERALEFSEARFAPLVESSTDAIIVADINQRILSWNPAAEQMFGFSAAEAIGRPVTELLPRPKADPSVVAYTNVLAGVPVTPYETTRYRKDGSALDVSVSLSPVVDHSSRPIALAAIVRDISERVRSERALQETREQLQAVVDSSGAGVYVGSIVDGRVIPTGFFGNFEGLTGYSNEELRAMGAEQLRRIVHPDDIERFRTVDQPILIAAGHGTAEYRVRHRDGTTRIISTQSEVQYADDGAPRAVSGVLLDITERRSLEAQLAQSQKIEAIGQLAGGVAHDLNNSLTIIIGFSDLILGELQADDPHRDDVAEIRRACDGAARLTSQLLAFGRRQVMQPRVIDVSAVVTDMLNMLRRVLGEDITVTAVERARGVCVRADPAQLEQVLVNLAINSRDAMPSGGSLTIEIREEELDPTVRLAHADAREGTYAMIAVTDTGTGMDERTRSRIFEPFYTTKERGKGTGLGLAMAYGIVKQSNGFIWVYSELNKGTTFKIYLPIVEAAPDPAVLQREPVALVRGTETILVAEDDEAVRRLIETILKEQGYTVLCVADAEAGITAGRTYAGTIHMLISDVVMPGASGRTFVETISAARPGIRALYISGYADDAILRHGVLREGTPFLSKPFGRDVLAKKVREVLDAPAGRAGI